MLKYAPARGSGFIELAVAVVWLGLGVVAKGWRVKCERSSRVAPSHQPVCLTPHPPVPETRGVSGGQARNLSPALPNDSAPTHAAPPSP
ncbi:hypothetical protein AAFF_G00199120 [Aldrovandia affinis]|uniref:Uncharacterized protein n=1 Tax=Aldrovandia affinis TaxID=143900 RepID=A0AAD7RI68_9TELE|nr:hypothetical protein AAFF_G00199120 [Aldrovandia affinis]